MDIAENLIRSPWLGPESSESSERPGASALTDDLSVDVAVIGAGIVGVAAAHELAEAGVSVALLEARTVCSGVTGNSTAKLSALHGLIYHRLQSRHGVEAAAAYAELSRSGLEESFAIAERHSIECRLERRPAFTYSEDEGERGAIEEEVEAAQAAGLETTYTGETDLPFPVAAAIRLDEQAQFDPVAWTRGLAGALGARGVQVFEDTRALSVGKGDSGLRVGIENGREVTCEHVVVATHMPFLDRGLYFARMRPERSYAVAGPGADSVPQGMYLSSDQPTRSIRSFTDHDGSVQVIVGGEGHKAGQNEPAERYRALEAELGERFGADRTVYRWASHDLISADLLPLIGRLTPFDERILTATGFNKWGLAAGIGAAPILRDLVLGRDNALAEVFDPTRFSLSSLPSIAKEGADFSLRFALDRIRHRTGDVPEPGEGLIAGSGREQHAVYRDPEGEVHRLSARCTHLGCIVAWNDAERTWDCPCHGSRFGPTGEVIQGPAVSPLARKD